MSAVNPRAPMKLTREALDYLRQAHVFVLDATTFAGDQRMNRKLAIRECTRAIEQMELANKMDAALYDKPEGKTA